MANEGKTPDIDLVNKINESDDNLCTANVNEFHNNEINSIKSETFDLNEIELETATDLGIHFCDAINKASNAEKTFLTFNVNEFHDNEFDSLSETFDLNEIEFETVIDLGIHLCDAINKASNADKTLLTFNVTEYIEDFEIQECGFEIETNLSFNNLSISQEECEIFLPENYFQKSFDTIDELSSKSCSELDCDDVICEEKSPDFYLQAFYSNINCILPYKETFELFSPELSTLQYHEECEILNDSISMQYDKINSFIKEDNILPSETILLNTESTAISPMIKKVRIQNKTKSKEKKKKRVRTIKLYEHYFPEIISDDEIPSPFKMNLLDFTRYPVKRGSTSDSLLERLSELEPNTVEDHLILVPSIYDQDSNSILSLTNSIEPSDLQSQVAPPMVSASENELSSHSSSTPTQTNADKSSSFSSSVSRSGKENDLKYSTTMSVHEENSSNNHPGIYFIEPSRGSSGIEESNPQPSTSRSHSTGSALERCRSFFKKLRVGPETEEERYECIYCARYFDTGEDLEKHLLRHNNRKIQRCDICFKTVTNLQRHMKRHVGSKPYPCQFCSKAFNTLIQLNQHSRVHTGHSAYECDYCDKTFSVAAHLQKHYKSHSQTLVYKCPHCQKAFAEQDVFQNHLRHHKIAPKPLQCSFCPRAFANEETLKHHLLDHEKSKALKCNFCIKSFNNLPQLNVHTFTHMDENSLLFQSRDYRMVTNLQRAASTSVYSLICAESHVNGEGHSDLEKPYVCPVCDESFSKVSHYNRHVRQHSIEKPFACSLCGEMFDKQKDFRKHRTTHVF